MFPPRLALLFTLAGFAAPMLFLHAGGWAGLHAALPASHFQVLGNLTLVRAMEFLVPTMLLMRVTSGLHS